MNIEKKFTASLHTHVRSLFDADINAKALCERIKELGGGGCAITDHGVLSSIEDYRRVFADNDLKLIPGCELYVDGGILGRLHLVVLARNDHGYHGLCKIVTAANKESRGDYPVITQERLFEIMKDYRGDVFALSACMQGVISAIFLLNRTVEKKIAKLREKQNGYISPESDKYVGAKTMVEELTAKVATITEKRDIAKVWADKKYTNQEKAIEKLDGEERQKAEAELAKNKEISQKAVTALAEKKEQLKVAKKEVSEATKALKDMEAQIDKWNNIQSEIDTISKELRSDEEITALAEDTAKAYIEAFGKGRFLAEVQYHGIEEEKICYPGVVRVAKKIGIPLVATNDVHILNKTPEERLKRQILRSLRFGTAFEEENPGDEELYLKDNFELETALTQIISQEDAVKAISNIDVVFNACDVKFETGKHYPKFRERKE